MLLGMGTIFGICGASLFIVAYFLLQRDKDFAKHIAYSLINFVAAALMLVSIAYDWNIGALINNGFWIILSLYGLAEGSGILRRKQQHALVKVRAED